MDLFTDPVDHEQLYKNMVEYLGKGWAEHFDLDASLRLIATLDTVNQDREQFTVYPDSEDVFRIFKLIPSPEDVNVVIIGQDPYYDGNANGIAFGCKVSMSPSLLAIKNAIISNGFDVEHPNSGMDLVYLAEQGVMLLNSSLTVRSHTPGSHNNIGWEMFVREVTNIIVKVQHKTIGKKIPFLLWGKLAKDSMKGLESLYTYYSNPNLHANPKPKIEPHILTTVHPAYAARMGLPWQCNHFSIVNNLLYFNNQKTIQWL